MSGLTSRQVECLRFISSYSRDNGIAPSYEEIADALGVASKSESSRLVLALEERGWLRRLSHRARSLEVVRTIPGEEPTDLSLRLETLSDESFARVAKAVLAEGQRRSGGRA